MADIDQFMERLRGYDSALFEKLAPTPFCEWPPLLNERFGTAFGDADLVDRTLDILMARMAER